MISHSPTKMASMPYPALFQFLTKVPIKQLIRFKCVDKASEALISSQDFIYAHLQTTKMASQNNPSLITSLVSDDYTVSHDDNAVIHFHTIKNHTDPVSVYSVRLKLGTYRFLPSCNGLVCFFGGSGRIYVCNPSIKTLLEIPYCNLKHVRLLSCGFGFDPSTRRYKIIRSIELTSPEKKGTKAIEVFTIRSRSWKRLKLKMGRGDGFLKGRSPIYSNGYFYWLSGNNSSRVFIQSLEVGSEVSGEINVPEEVYGKDCSLLCLVELGGKLCVVDLDFESKRRMDIWECDDEKNKKCCWVRKTIVHMSERVDGAWPVMIHGGEILLNRYIGGLGSLVWYNLERRVFRNFDRAPPNYFLVSPFVESIVPL